MLAGSRLCELPHQGVLAALPRAHSKLGRPAALPPSQGAIHPHDIKQPAHMERVHALLQRNTAALNMAYTPY